jgi:hypothetical protein
MKDMIAAFYLSVNGFLISQGLYSMELIRALYLAPTVCVTDRQLFEILPH